LRKNFKGDDMKTSEDGKRRIKRFESLRLKAYLCPAGIPTIGYGCTDGVTIEDVKCGRTCTQVEAEQMFAESLKQFETGVNLAVNLNANQNQFDAMVSLAYNIGLAGFVRSTVLKAHKRGDTASAARAFGLWNKAPISGKLQVVPGLVTRRAQEAALYLQPTASHSVASLPEMPQDIAPERPMSESRITRGAATAGVITTVATTSEVLSSVNSVKSSVDELGTWFVPVLLVVVVALCGYIIYERFVQRKEGRA
jgi:GH24 family phage-related lysozyme (muramidase)